MLTQAQAVQERRLESILARNAGCAYGRRFGFATIGDAAGYRARVPVATYDDLRPDIDRMAAGETRVLADDDVVAFEETGGSTGARKLVPYTRAGLEGFARALAAWLDDLACAFPAIASGRSYWAISPAARAPRTTSGGIPIGLPADAGYLGAELAPLVAETLAVPPQIGALTDLDRWRDRTCLALLACEDLALLSVWSPTFLTALIAHLAARGSDLAARLAQGSEGIGADRARAELVAGVLASPRPDWRQLWPRLALVSCWDQAASRGYARALRDALPGVPLQGKGLIATEGVITIPLCGLSMPVLAVDSGFYEFRDARGRALLAGELSPGSEYEVLMTTESGLYRYATGDRVRVHGYVGEAPLLEFIGRGAHASDLCGEKLTEAFVAGALAPLGLRFALVAPAAASQLRYVLFVDAEEVSDEDSAAIEARAERSLCRNPQYAYARGLGQLAPLAARRCVRPLDTWLEAGLARGSPMSVVKLSALSPERDWENRFRMASP